MKDDLRSNVLQYQQSIQAKDSLYLLGARVRLGLTTRQIANRINVPFSDYLRFESGDPTISESDYKQIIDKINEI